MSWTDEEIDNLFRDGASSQSFEYNDAYFAEIEAALPVDKRRKDFLWMGTALLFIAALTTGYFINDTNTTSFDENDQLANLELNEMKNINTAKTAEIENVNDNQLVVLDNRSAESAADNGSIQNDSSLNPSTNTTNNSNSAVNSAKQDMERSSMYDHARRTGNTNNAKSVSVSTNQSSQSSSNEELTQKAAAVDENEGLRNELKSNFPSQFEMESAPITALLNTNSANQLDQGLSRDVSASLKMPYLSELRPKAGLYGEFNVGFSQSLITPSKVVSKSIGGGIGVEAYLGNFSLTTGLNFKASYHDDLFLTRKGKVYGFGSQEGKNVYDFQQIYSLELPITLGYNFGRHNLNIGVRPSVVIGGKTQLQEFENNQLLRTSMKNGLVEGGLMRFGLKPTFGYAYRVNNWTIGANIGIQMMESVNEEYISGFNNQFPIDGQLYLRRTIRLRR